MEEKRSRAKVTFTIQSGPAKVPADADGFSIEQFGEVIDLRALAAQAIAAFPTPVDIDHVSLATFAVKRHYGKYVRVNDYPPGIDRHALSELTRRVLRWAYWIYRAKQVTDTRYDSSRTFVARADACPRAAAMHALEVNCADVTRLPFDDCWNADCGCDYLSNRSAKRFL